ncbi:MAG TPA: acetyl-CoA carboxylase biotin carboxylase subunit, partial [Kofleriaceae bacterium]|nr:acetyl-CoA carboxylase biotin carboxylase subunit [Kofleriaceae bacterium]
PPTGPDLRIDTHVESGYVVPPYYDSLICKVITRGPDRATAVARMITALEALVCEGVPTTISMHLAILRSAKLRDGAYDNRTIPGWPPSA